MQDLNNEEVQQAIELITNNSEITETQKTDLINNLWKINYIVKPPTMEEFLTPQYIGAVADKLFPHVRRVLTDFMNPSLDNKKRVLALSTHIGYGKSSVSTILILYIMVHLSYMKSPKKFFNLNEMGSLVAVLLSFTLKKASQTLLQPFIQLLKASPIFHQTRTEDGLVGKQKAIPINHIAYTTAGRMGAVQLAKDIHITVISDRASLLGMNVFAGVASEISFWIEKGISVEEIWSTFTDLRDRINNRFNHAYLTATILDSSPIDIDLSPIDKWLYTPGEADSDPEVMFINAKLWDSFPEKFPIWLKTGETFSVYRGSGAKPPKIIYDDKELQDFSDDEIFHVPIDLKLQFEQNLKKNIADGCAYPAGGLMKLFEAYHYIDEIFSPILKNVYTPIEIPEERDPTRLIWDQIKDKFFIHLGNNHYEFYRSPMEKRSIHIDLSETGDISGIGMSHKELNIKGEIIIIHDFLIPLHKGQTRINIDAVIEFILDLKRLGKIKLFKVTADQYQSATLLQRLRRENIDAEKLSVDKETGPYMVYSSWVKSGKIKAGNSIHLKNNLKSLVEVRREKGSIKIDHIQGSPIYTDSGSWITSQIGYRAKDISDVACGSAYNLIIDTSIPKYIFDDRITEASSEASKQKVLKGIHDRLGLKIKKTY